MKNRYIIMYVSCLACFLPGCSRIIDWGKKEFTQAPESVNFNKIPATYVRSIKMYDEFSTSALLDILWLSDQVRTAYTASYVYKRGKDADFGNSFLRRQLEENKHYISFYVLAPHAYYLSEKDSPWSLFLRIGDSIVQPVDIKVIDLVPEYKSFFGDKFNRFRTAYHVKFDANDIEGKPLLHQGITEMTLYFRTMAKEVRMSWPIVQENSVVEATDEQV